MGLDSIIEKDEKWKNSINYILIKNGICRTMKEINDSLNKSIDEAERKGVDIFDDYKKTNPNHLKAVESKKPKPKFNNNNY
jgi:hypothetical protein